MARGGDARGAVHVDADIIRARFEARGATLAGVHPHAHAHGRAVGEGRLGEPPLRRGRGAHGVDSDGKDDEQGIALHAHLDAAVLEGLAQEPRMRLQDLVVAIRSELALELGGALDVGEEEREGTRRQPSPRAHPARIVAHPAFAKTCCTP